MESKIKKVLIVDDEPKIVEVIQSYLERDGFTVKTASTGEEALKVFHIENPAILILDLMLPDMTGEEVCKRVRAQSDAGILMLTAKSHEKDRVSGFSIGADDYVVKPFSPSELVSRVNALFRRLEPSALLTDRMEYDAGNLIIEGQSKSVWSQGELINLTPHEYELLSVLARRPGRVLTRSDLIQLVMGQDFMGDERTIDVHIKNLRQKIEPDSKHPRYILTVFGYGYRFGDKI